jgi:hypothetical protein
VNRKLTGEVSLRLVGLGCGVTLVFEEHAISCKFVLGREGDERGKHNVGKMIVPLSGHICKCRLARSRFFFGPVSALA